MTCRVRKETPYGIPMNENEAALLSFIARRAGGPSKSVAVSMVECASAVERSIDTVRRGCHALSRKGLVAHYPIYHENGAQGSNCFVVTDLGWEMNRALNV